MLCVLDKDYGKQILTLDDIVKKGYSIERDDNNKIIWL